MAAGMNRQILLKSRPEGAPSLDNFELAQRPDAGACRWRGADPHPLSTAASDRRCS
jgi:hypothetical protein